MDIQSVIVSVEELNKTKKAIADAIRAKGVNSKGRFSTFVNEINSISAGVPQDYLDNLDTGNIFIKNNQNTLQPVGNISETHEDIKDNVVNVYSLYDINNVQIVDGPYKDRINYNTNQRIFSVMVNNQEFGHVPYTILSASVTPQPAENTDGNVVIKYTTKGQEHTLTMPIKDMPMVQPNNIYMMMQTPLDEHVDDTNFKQHVNVEDYMPSLTHLKGVSVGIGVYQSRPEIFNTLNNLGVYSSINAMLILLKDDGDFEYIPVKLIKSLASQTIPLHEGYNAAVLELEDDRLVFHYSDTAGRLNPQCIVSTEDGVYSTDTTILDKIKQHKQQPNYMIGIAIHHDGSPITEEEVKQMGIY